MSIENDPAQEALYEVPRRLINLLGNPDSSSYHPGIAVLAWHNKGVLSIGYRTLTESGSKMSVVVDCPKRLHSEIQTLFDDLKIEINFGTKDWTPTSTATMLSSDRRDQTILSIIVENRKSWEDVLTHVRHASKDWLDMVDHQRTAINTLVYLNSKIETINADVFRLLEQKGLRTSATKSERSWYAVKGVCNELGKQLLWSRCIHTGSVIGYIEGAHHAAGCHHLSCIKQLSEKIVWVNNLYDALDPHEGSSRRHPKSAKIHYTLDGILTICRNIKGQHLTRVLSEVTCKNCLKKMK